jgi:hypothetical protein
LGAGLLFRVAAAGIRSILSVLGGSARNDSDDLCAVGSAPSSTPPTPPPGGESAA